MVYNYIICLSYVFTVSLSILLCLLLVLGTCAPGRRTLVCYGFVLGFVVLCVHGCLIYIMFIRVIIIHTICVYLYVYIYIHMVYDMLYPPARRSTRATPRSPSLSSGSRLRTAAIVWFKCARVATCCPHVIHTSKILRQGQMGP